MAAVRRWLNLAPILLLASVPSFAQEELENLLSEREKDEAELRRLSGQDLETLAEEELAPTRFMLPSGEWAPRLRLSQDREVDADVYVVGPGDVIQLYIWGRFDKSYLLQVDPEGNIIVPTVGTYSVSGLTLREARALIHGKTAAKYPGVDITITLTSMRWFTVYATGAVVAEGSYTVHPTTRVSELIEKAGGYIDELRGKVEQEIEGKTVTVVEPARRQPVSRRAVEIHHSDGSVDRVDMDMYHATGDMRYNPYLRMGDLVHVRYRRDVVYVYGSVNRQGAFEFQPGDTLADLLVLAGGVSGTAPIDEVKVWRFPERGGQAVGIDLVGGSAGPRALDSVVGTPLQSDDMVFLRTRSNWQPKPTVHVRGQVLYRGRYRIVPEQTRLRDLIDMAGGFTEDASLADAVVVRVKARGAADPEYARLRSLQAVSGLADMSPEDRAYLKTKNRERRGQLAVDFVKLFERGDESHNILLEAGDVVYVPEKRRTVTVSGQVKQPGLVDHVAGATVRHYLAWSGGYAWRANRRDARLIRARTGIRLPLDDRLELEPGDEIWIPEKEYRDWWAFTQGTMRTIAETLTLVVLVRSF